MRPEAQDAVVDWLGDDCANFKRKRGRNAGDRERFLTVLGTVVANALRASRQPIFRAVHYSRANDGYQAGSVYCPGWLGSTNVVSAVDALEHRGLVTCQTGRWGSDFGPGIQSTFSATDDLIGELESRGVTPAAVTLGPNAPVLRLKDPQKQLVEYDPGAEDVAAMTHRLRSYNAFIADRKLVLDITYEDRARLVEDVSRAKGPRRLPYFDETNLYRVFNDGRWDRGGRFFGGWWQRVPSRWRSNIKIDGHPTCELDFSG